MEGRHYLGMQIEGSGLRQALSFYFSGIDFSEIERAKGIRSLKFAFSRVTVLFLVVHPLDVPFGVVVRLFHNFRSIWLT